VLVSFVISQKGLYYSAFDAEDTHAAPRLSPVSRCPRPPEPGLDRGRPVEDHGSPTKDRGDLGDRSTDNPRSQVPLLWRRAPTEVGPHPDQGPALPLHWLLEVLFGQGGQRHGPAPSSGPVLGRAAGYAGRCRTSVGPQACSAVGTQQIHGLALADAGVFRHRKQLNRELLRDRRGG